MCGRTELTTGVISAPFYVSLPAHATVLWPFAIAFAPKRRVRGCRVAGSSRGVRVTLSLILPQPLTQITGAGFRKAEEIRVFRRSGREGKHFTRFLFGMGGERTRGKIRRFPSGEFRPILHPAREPCRTLPTTILTDAAVENVNV